MEAAITIENLSKKFKIGAVKSTSISESWRKGISFNARASNEFWALENINLEIPVGKAVGIIGKNGAGKSTLLKILSRITYPTTGRIVINGQVSALLEVGTGFHPELTGRENVYLNATILGMSIKEVSKKFDEIVEFSGVNELLDTPIKHYSSGMQVRLAFSVAAHLEPDILIIDEVLAVGDYEFQKKCLGKMEEVSQRGRTVLFVSHNLQAVNNLCDSAILIDKGQIVKQGETSNVISYYTRNGLEHVSKWSSSTKNLSISFSGVEVNLSEDRLLEIFFFVESNQQHKSAFVAFDICNAWGSPIMQVIPHSEPFIPYLAMERRYCVRVDLPPLIPDTYSVSAWIGSHNTDTFDWQKNIVSFEIMSSPISDRNYSHSRNNGFIIPTSKIIESS